MKRILMIILAMLMVTSLMTGCSKKTETPSAEVPNEATQEATEVPAATEETAAETTAAEATAAPAMQEDGSLQAIMDKGFFIMGLDDSFPPMGFRDDKGELVGFDIDMARGIAEHMGIKVELLPIDWSAKELELEAGNIDVIWNGYTITEERKEKVLMSAPYMKNMQVILVKNDSPITTLADLEGKTVAVQEGSSAQGVIQEDAGLSASIGEVVAFKDYVTALMDVDSGQVDALGVDLVVADYYMAKKPDKYRILDETIAPEEYGIGFRKGEQAFHDAVMAAFEEMKKDGSAAEISNRWFGRDVTA